MPSGLYLLGTCGIEECISFNACGSEGYVRDTKLVPLALVMNVTSDGNDDFFADVCAEVEIVGRIVTVGVLADTVVSANLDSNRLSRAEVNYLNSPVCRILVGSLVAADVH